MSFRRFLIYSILFGAQASWAPLAAAQDRPAVSLGEMTVTGTREEEPKAETPATVGAVGGNDIARIRPSHPSEVARRVPGVHVSVTGGEGHLTSIRQPLTTSPVYLFLEDGVPSRSTGFFNHNALYELNVPQSGGMEIMKGPGTALYGSDAIGGIVNVLTRPAPLSPEGDITVEGGSFGWWRTLLSAGTTKGDNGFRGDLNMTHTDGWRDHTAYNRQSATFRWDRQVSVDSALKGVISGSNIDQETAGSSALLKNDYLNSPKTNYTPISFREVKALRGSLEYSREKENTLLTLTPYFRYDWMKLLPNWSLTYDPVVYTTQNASFGLMTKCRRDFEPMRTRLVAGVDVDYSPGSYAENQISTTKSGQVFTSYTVGAKTYGYDVAFLGISPYVHGEFSPVDKLRVQAGLRYDHIGYDYENNLSTVQTGTKRRPESTELSFDHISPKVGATYEFTPDFNAFVSYRHGFRAPSESQLFRQGQAVNTVDLDPIKSNSYETGVRGSAIDKRLTYEVSAYYMLIKDDIVSFTNTDGTRETMNAGETLHRGVEVGLGVELTKELRLDVSYSYAKHTYDDWSPKPGTNYSGNEIAVAPKQVGSTRLSYAPKVLNGGKIEIEWEKLGSYWMDDANTAKYDGHDLFNIFANYIRGDWEVFGKVANLTDERYAARATFTTARGEEFSPGNPLTFYAGLKYRFL